jgi:hypothetical protein
MFEKLFMLVKNNAGTAVMNNPLIAEKNRESVLNDASSTIIEVLKGQMEGGKLKDMVKYFQFVGVFNNPLISSAVKRFANKLNNYYGIEPAEALKISKAVIPPAMQELMKESRNGKNNEFALTTLLSKLSGNFVDMTAILNNAALA